MTSQTKHFIELPDVVAVQLACRRCGAAVCLSLAKEIRLETFRICPNCSEPWLALPGGSTVELTVKEFITALRTLACLIHES
jgi:hypothetical protein